METEEKYNKLLKLIKTDLLFAEKEKDSFDDELLLKISVSDLRKIGFEDVGMNDLELQKSLDRLVREKIIISYEAHIDPLLYDLSLGLPPFLDYYKIYVDETFGLNQDRLFIFDPSTGYFIKNKIKAKFLKNSKQYNFLVLLNSKPGIVFSYDVIVKEVYKKPELSKPLQKNIYDLAEKIRAKLSAKGIKDIFLETNKGYGLKK